MNGQFVEFKKITSEEFEVLAGFINLVAVEGGLYFDSQANPITPAGMAPVVFEREGQLYLRMDYVPVLAFDAIQSGLAVMKAESEKPVMPTVAEQKPDTATVKANLQALFAAVMETYAADFAASNPSPVANRGFKLYEQDVQQDLKKILEQF